MQCGLADAKDGRESQIELSIVIPCLNEAETIAICVEKAKIFIARANIRGEVVAADNGSTDGSIQLASANGARIVHVAERDYGAALRAGIFAAHGRCVIIGTATTATTFPISMDLYRRCATTPIW